MRNFLAIALLFSCSIVVGQRKLNLVPIPVRVTMGKGFFTINNKTRIVINKKEITPFEHFNANFEAEYLRDYIFKNYGYNLQIVEIDSSLRKSSNLILLIKGSNGRILHNTYKNESPYILSVTKNTVSIAGANESIFYGIQTFLQLLPIQKDNSNLKNHPLSIPQLSITDYPRFEYRGIHFDVCRHFFPVSFIKKYIDYLAAYKFNTFHWHLTDDQGWRVEIKKYPELTKTGAWRNGTIIGRYPGNGSDNKPYGGFYTQAEIKEVVQYAKDRYIDVIPEIEMPGHSSAAIAAYPWLSCFPEKPTEIPANMISQKSIAEQKAGRIKLVQETWGVFDDVFCAGKDSTFMFLENVLDEVLALFPSKYIHIGGDESPKTHWKICPACQKRIKDGNLKDEHELQSYFVQRIEKYLNSKGRTIIGWDEILEGGLAPNAVVMSWRGEAGGIEAAKQKHQVIMTPGSPVYFDHTQSKNEDSVTIGGYNPIENVYAWDPVPKELTAEQGKYILGAQANMWAEYFEYPSKVEYMLFPRITALSEVLWSPAAKRDWNDFERRLPVIFGRLDKQKINYSKAYYDLKATVLPTDDYNGVLWKFESKSKNGFIAYPSSTYASDAIPYTTPLLITSNKHQQVCYFLNGRPVSCIYQDFFFNKATGKKITLANQPSKNYPGDGAFTLVNGVQNEKGLAKSSEFLGFNGTDLDATIDLGTVTDVKEISLHTFAQTGSWIYPPKQNIVVMISDDGINFTSPENEFGNILPGNGVFKIWFSLSRKSVATRYIRIIAKNYGIIPAGNPGAGNPAWLFVDEIEVQ